VVIEVVREVFIEVVLLRSKRLINRYIILEGRHLVPRFVIKSY